MATAKRRAVLTALCAAVMLLGGCDTLDDMLNLDSTWTPQESEAISIASDGSVTEIVQETLDQSYYDLTELEEMINAEVDEYNAENGEDSITVKSLTNDDSTVTLKLWYSSAEDYAAFNNVEFFCGSIISAQLEGYLFDTSFYRVKEGELSGSEVSYTAVFNDMSAEVVIVQAPMEVHIEGQSVTYVSVNAEMISADTVNATGDQEEEEGLVLPSSKVYEGEEETYAEQKIANRVYIVY
ncbi:MAG: hypothetical protein LUG93_07500 [Lachnospiraceae bacterium]|nr:hypothetical protein [Lachnospiraceae bacterium]